MRVSVLLTFDFEAPLGGFESYESGLFKPAAKLLALANQLNIPIVLFADICSLIMYRDWDIEYYNRFKSQIQNAIRNNHDVQLHIHPHWLTSEYKNNTYIPSSRFALSNFKNDTNYSIERIIDEASATLIEICKEVDDEYECVAYRAGGYNVEPESKIILNSLYKNGIRIDSSVIQGYYQKQSYSRIDYTGAPRKNYWKISIDGPLTKESDSDLYEIPITRMPISIPYIIRRKLYKDRNKDKIKSRKYNNTGKGFATISSKPGLVDKLRMAWNPVVLSCDRDYMTLDHLQKIVDWNITKYKKNQDIIITLISHPKSMGEYHLDLFRDFIHFLQQKYDKDISFITYQTLYQKLSK